MWYCRCCSGYDPVTERSRDEYLNDDIPSSHAAGSGAFLVFCFWFSYLNAVSFMNCLAAWSSYWESLIMLLIIQAAT